MIGCLPQGDAHGQSDHHYLFKTLTFREGLSHSHVTDVVQDSLGYLWLGTENGLNRYDGTEVVVFKHILDDTTSLLNNNIRKIFLDSQQRMWLLTASGVCQYQPVGNRFKSYPHDTEADHGGLPLDIIENSEGQLLLLSHHNTVSVFSEQHDRFEKRFTLPIKATARSLCLFRGRLFVGAQRFLLEVDPLMGSIINSYELFDDSYPLSSGITQLTVANDQLWIAGMMMHLHRFDPVARTIEKIDDLPYITSLASLNPQVILAGSHEGVFLYHTITRQVSPLRSVDYAPFLYNVNQVFVDRESNLWAASPQQGVIHTAGQRVFRDVRHLNEALVPYTNDISSLQTISKQQLWIGLNTGKVVAVDLQDQRHRMFYPDSVPALPPGTGTVFSISEDCQQRVWIGSYEGGLRHYEPSSGRFVLSNAAVDSLGIRSNDIRSIVEDQRGQLWLAVHGRGVDVYDPARKEVVASHGLSNGDTDPYISDWTFQLAIAPDSTVWIASASGLQMIKGTTKKYFQHHADRPGSLSNDKVTSLLRDARGHLWIGTAEGLNVLNPRDSSFIKFTTRQGLSDNYVSSLSTGQNRAGRGIG